MDKLKNNLKDFAEDLYNMLDEVIAQTKQGKNNIPQDD